MGSILQGHGEPVGFELTIGSGAGGDTNNDLRPPVSAVYKEIWLLEAAVVYHDDAARTVKWSLVDTAARILMKFTAVGPNPVTHSYYLDCGEGLPLFLQRDYYLRVTVESMAAAKNIVLSGRYQRYRVYSQ
jgi:hypothetical protein